MKIEKQNKIKAIFAEYQRLIKGDRTNMFSIVEPTSREEAIEKVFNIKERKGKENGNDGEGQTGSITQGDTDGGGAGSREGSESAEGGELTPLESALKKLEGLTGLKLTLALRNLTKEEKEAYMKYRQEQKVKAQEEAIAQKFAEEKSKNYSGWYKEVLDSSSNLKEAVSKIISKIQECANTYNDWASREYKENSNTVIAGEKYGELESGNPIRIDAVNEKRRQNMMRNARKEADQMEEGIKLLLERCGVSDEDAKNYVPEHKTFEELIANEKEPTVINKKLKTEKEKLDILHRLAKGESIEFNFESEKTAVETWNKLKDFFSHWNDLRIGANGDDARNKDLYDTYLKPKYGIEWEEAKVIFSDILNSNIGKSRVGWHHLSVQDATTYGKEPYYSVFFGKKWNDNVAEIRIICKNKTNTSKQRKLEEFRKTLSDAASAFGLFGVEHIPSGTLKNDSTEYDIEQMIARVKEVVKKGAEPITDKQVKTILKNLKDVSESQVRRLNKLQASELIDVLLNGEENRGGEDPDAILKHYKDILGSATDETLESFDKDIIEQTKESITKVFADAGIEMTEEHIKELGNRAAKINNALDNEKRLRRTTYLGLDTYEGRYKNEIAEAEKILKDDKSSEEEKSSAKVRQVIAQGSLLLLQQERTNRSIRAKELLDKFGIKYGKTVTDEQVVRLFRAACRDKETIALFDMVQPIVEKLGISYFGKTSSIDADGESTNSGKIKYDFSKLAKGNVSPEHIASTILHEKIHQIEDAVSYVADGRASKDLMNKRYTDSLKAKIQKVIDNVTPQQIEAWNEINDLYKICKKRSDMFNGDFDGRSYAMVSVSEFISEYANPEHRAELKKLGLWERFVNGVLKLIGVQKRGYKEAGTAYDKMYNAFEKLCEGFNEDAYFAYRATTDANKTADQLKTEAGLRKRSLDSQKDSIVSTHKHLSGEEGMSWSASSNKDERNRLKAERMVVDEVVRMLGDYDGIKLVENTQAEGQNIAYDNRNNLPMQAKLSALGKAVNFIKRSLSGNQRGSFTIELPLSTITKIKNVMGRDFDSHNITANSIVHAKKNHGVDGKKISDNSIPLRDSDFELAPYIMTAPSRVEKGSTDVTGRESIRFYKDLSNGYVVVAEKELKNSPYDMETITMWAEKSSGVADARNSSSPAIDVQNVITSIDAAKIRKDAEIEIENDVKKSKNAEFMRVFHGSAAAFDHFDSSHFLEGEGSMVYGAGHYVTNVEGTARMYATQQAGKKDIPYITYVGNFELTHWQLQDTCGVIARRMRTSSGESVSIEDAFEIAKKDFSMPYSPGTTGYNIKQALFNTTAKDWHSSRKLYEVEIPDDNGIDYIAWNERPSKYQLYKFAKAIDNQWICAMIRHMRYDKEEGLRDDCFYDMVSKNLQKKIDEKTAEFDDSQKGAIFEDWFFNSMGRKTGEHLYWIVDYFIRGNKEYGKEGIAVSKFLSDAGFVGIKVPTGFANGGDGRGTNYVVFKDSDLKITNRVEFLKNDEGVVYGWAEGNRIHLTTEGFNPNTPIHEYTHLRAKSVKKNAPELWKNIKSLLKDNPLVDVVLGEKGYEGLDEDGLMSEVLSRISGSKNADKLVNAAKELLDKGYSEKEAKGFVDKVKDAINKLWSWVGKELFGIEKFESVDEVTDRVLYDLINKTDLKLDGEGANMRPEMAIGSKRKGDMDAFTERYDKEFVGEWERTKKKLDVDGVKYRTDEGYKNGDYYVDVENNEEYKLISLNLFSRFKNESKYGVVARTANHFYFVDYFGDGSFKARAIFDIEAERELINLFENEIKNKTFRTTEDFDRLFAELVNRRGEHSGDNVSIENRKPTDGDGVLASRQLDEESDSIGGDGKGSENSGGYVTSKTSYDGSRKPRIVFVNMDEVNSLSLRSGGTSTERNADSLSHAKSHAQSAIDALGGKGKVVGDKSELDAEDRRILSKNKNAMGWYNPKTGEVTIYLPNCKSDYEVDRTVQHEKIGHEGMRGLLGKGGMKQFFDGLWQKMSPEERKEISAIAAFLCDSYPVIQTCPFFSIEIKNNPHRYRKVTMGAFI